MVCPISGQQDFPGIPVTFYRGPLSYLSFQAGTLTSGLSVCLLRDLARLHLVHTYGSGERESKRGVCRSQLRALLLLARSGPCCQGLCRKPTCLVRTGVLVTREAQEATDPLLHIPLPRLPDNAGNRKALPSSFRPSSRGLCSRKTRLLSS